MSRPNVSLPTLTTQSVFTTRSSVSIDASKQHVWDILLDFASYGEWNPYIRTQQVISDNDNTPLLSQKPAPGRRLQLRLHVPPTMDDAGTKSFTAEEIVTHVDDANFRFAWRFPTPARWLLTAERWQVLRDGGPGESQKIIYETWEFYGGLLAYLLWLFMSVKLQSSFDAMSRALKDRAERTE